ncbi:unnamed protein product, partial [Brassica oleracea var. botrytis]
RWHPHSTQISTQFAMHPYPRKIPRNKLVKLFQKSWVTNYGKIHETSMPIQLVDSSIHRGKDGAIEIAFFSFFFVNESSSLRFFTCINMISPCEEPPKIREYLIGIL